MLISRPSGRPIKRASAFFCFCGSPSLRAQTLLFRLQLHQAAIGVDGGFVAGVRLRACLLIAGLGVLHLDTLRIDQRSSSHQLQVGAGDGEHDFLSRLARIQDSPRQQTAEPNDSCAPRCKSIRFCCSDPRIS